MRRAVHCSNLLDCMLLIKQFKRLGYKWENGNAVEYKTSDSRYHFNGNQTAYAVDSNQPNTAFRSNVGKLRQSNVAFIDFNEFYDELRRL